MEGQSEKHLTLLSISGINTPRSDKIQPERNKMLIIVRGLPGSGKTTFAKALIEMNDEFLRSAFAAPETTFAKALIGMNEVQQYKPLSCICADDYPGGRYDGGYKPELNGLAHAWCLTKTEELLKSNKNVIVHNTFAQRTHIKPYQVLARAHNVKFFVLTSEGDYISDHQVPHGVFRKMEEGWERWP